MEWLLRPCVTSPLKGAWKVPVTIKSVPTCIGCGQHGGTICAACLSVPSVRHGLNRAQVERTVGALLRLGLNSLTPQTVLQSTALTRIHQRLGMGPGRPSLSDSTIQRILETVLGPDSGAFIPSLFYLRDQGRVSQILKTCSKHNVLWGASLFINRHWNVKDLYALTELMAADIKKTRRTCPPVGKTGFITQGSAYEADVAPVLAAQLPVRIVHMGSPRLGESRLKSLYLLNQPALTARYVEEIDIEANLPLELGKIVLIHELVHVALWLQQPYHACGTDDPLEEAICHIVSIIYINSRLQASDLSSHERRILKHRSAACHSAALRAGSMVREWFVIAETKGWPALAAAFYRYKRLI
eukprot:Protomagalhaensia_sp_Gyna_25__6004@NODE_93_length_5325_cov_100_196557_g72_i0_p2_GENE_NODE_93_length_5325_cov_100_196557_g72_i0NODE_93_length_5325_cov_100_196557_g72_i0_p2_ORF_typecomplete_len357_score37_89DA1like/PF12315_8/2e06_NODE_93_length_5325_cov_100_196557_g72_i014342504